MAEHKISGTDMVVLISTDGTTYATVVCLTGSNFTRGTTIIDAKSACGPDTLPGTQDNGLDFAGQIMEAPTSLRISTDDLDDYWRNKQTIYWKYGKAIPVIGDETYYGTGFIAELNVAAQLDSVTTFTAKIGIYGLASKTTATS